MLIQDVTKTCLSADVSCSMFLEMRAMGTLANYECNHCIDVDDGERAIRRDFVLGVSVTSQNG